VPRFGPFEVDFTTGEMRKSGTRVRIPDQPLRILQKLLEHPGDLVSREELRDLLWPSGTYVDFERGLNAAVGKLRQSLNDSADRPIYVETVARKGYRFVAPVIEATPEAPVIIPVEKLPTALGSRAKSAAMLVAGLAAGFAILWLAAWRAPRGGGENRVVRLDLDAGNDVSQPAIAPDGSTVAFISSGRLVVRRLDESTITPLPGTEGATSPFFSPDGKWVGYFADRKLRKTRVEGGESVLLCDAAVDHGGTWTDDGQIIAALSASGELSTVPATGGTPRPFSSLQGEPPEITDHRMPVAMLGGKGVLFISGTGISTGTLRVLPRARGPAKTLVQGASTGRYLASGYLLFSRGDTLFVAPMDPDRLEVTGPESPFIERVGFNHFRGADFDVSASGTLVYRTGPERSNRALMWLDSSGLKQRAFARGGAYSTPRLSPDSRRVALTSEGAIWICDLARQTMTRLTFGSEAQCCPAWSPDGGYVVFASATPSGSQPQTTLSWARWDGSGTAQQLPAAHNVSAVPFSFSSDGRWLAFHRNELQTGYDLGVAPVDGTGGSMRLGQPRSLLRQAGLQAAPDISQDGRWIAYSSNDETGRMEVYVTPFSPEGPPPQSKWQVSTDGGRGPRWSEAGREILFRSLDDHLMAAAFSTSGNSFHAERPRLWYTQRLADTGGPMNFDVAADGKRVIALFDTHETKPDETHLRVLLNVNEELRRYRVNH
jgi:Tol biopolymer transport system component/DNA-binding winged helix-turn-helix (wHTH) protein